MPVASLLTWLPLASLAFGGLFLVLGASAIVKDRRRRQQWQIYPGRVVGSRLDDGKIQCRVAYVNDGREYVFWNRYSSTMMTDPVGKSVRLLANPDDPYDAVVNRGLVGGAVVGVVFLAFGALSAGIGLCWLR